MEITVILENTSVNNKVKGIHGLSILVKTDKQTILYDFGPRNHLCKNSNLLGVNLAKVDIAVLSHNHMDHGGDLSSFIQNNKTAAIHTNSDLSERTYSNLILNLKVPVGVSIDRQSIQRLTIHDKTEEIASGVVLLKLSEYANRSTINKSLFVKESGKYIHDIFSHESALLIFENNEIVVFCSCSHHGVTAILDDVKTRYPNHRIKAFVGGFHLFNPLSRTNETISIIEETAEKLQGNDIRFYTGHCTGEFAYQILRNKLGERIQRLSTGMKVAIV